VYWGIYRANDDALTGPTFQSDAASRVGRQILASYEAVWDSSSPKTGSLSATDTHSRVAQSHAIEEGEISKRIVKLGRRLCPAATVPESGGCLCLLRHGETDLNHAGIISGSLDVGISAAGRERARTLAHDLRRTQWTRIVSSSLQRATDTLGEVFGGNLTGVEFRDELRERSMGDVEGHSKQHYASSLPQYRGVDLLGAFHTQPSGGESYCDVYWRVAVLLDDLKPRVEAGERILICSHEAPLRMMLMALNGLTPEAAIALDVPNCTPLYFTAP